MYKDNFIVALKHKGKVLRELDDIVELPFGSEYSIMLKNKNSVKAVTSIEVDGENALDNKRLIVKPNDSVELKGFMKGNKVHNNFKFINKTKEITDYRGDRLDDGLIRVEYTFEKPEKENNEFILEDPPNPYRRRKKGEFSTKFMPTKLACSTSKTTFNTQPNSDEGITVKGSNTSQDFKYGSTGTLDTKSRVITLKLKGVVKNGKTVEKPVTVKSKKVCPTCGRKWRSVNCYCGRCGTYLE